MAIQFSCECGKRLRVPDKFAGREAQCPACKQVMKIPKAAPAAPQHRAAPPNPPQRRPAPQRPPGDAFNPLAEVASPAEPVSMPPPPPGGRHRPSSPQPAGAGSGFDDFEPLAAAKSPPRPAAQSKSADAPPQCPNCGAEVAKEAVLCIGCGFNLLTGKATQTKLKYDEHKPMASTEKGPLFILAGIEVTITKIVLLVILVGGALGLYFGFFAPAKQAREDFDALTKKLEVPLRDLSIEAVKLKGPPDGTLTEIYWIEESLMMAVPDVLQYGGVVAHKASGAPLGKVRGEYNRHTGELLIRIPKPTLDGFVEHQTQYTPPR